MVHFFCSTPLQIYTAIVLSKADFKSEDKTIYVIDYFEGCEDFIKRLYDLDIFTDVKLLSIKKIYERIKTRKYGYVPFVFWNCLYYLSSERVLSKNDIEIQKDDIVFFSYLEPLCLMLANINKKRHLNIHFYGFEDGIGAYAIPLDRLPGKLEKYLSVEPYYKKEEYWVYRPEYILEKNRYKDRVKKIQFTIDATLEQYMDMLWNYKNYDIILPKVLFFDDIISDKNLDKIVSAIFDTELEGLCVKLHPRRFNKHVYSNFDLCYLEPQSAPFEYFLLKSNVNETVLISVFSSSVFNAVYMFDYRPVIIFLYKLIEGEGYTAIINEMTVQVSNLKDIYGLNSDDYIFIPESIQELQDCMKKACQMFEKSLVKNKKEI